MAIKKRASVAAAPPAKKRQSTTTVGSDTKRQCNQVAKAVLESDELPTSCKAMLSGMSHGALSSCQDDRHPFEAAIVQMVNATLSGLEESMIKRNAETEFQAGNAEAEKMARASRRTDAQSDLTVKTDVVAEKKAASQETESALQAAKAVLADAAKTQKKGDVAFQRVADEKQALERFRTTVFVPLKDYRIQELPKMMHNEVSNFCTKVGVEKQLILASVSALKLAPADRTGFLATAVNQLEQTLASLSTAADEKVTKEDVGKQERASAVADATGKKDTAQAANAAANAAFEQAQTDKKNAQNSLKAADAACRNFFPDMKKMMDGFDSSKTKLEQFQSTVMVAFKELETLAPPPPAPVEAEPVADESAAASGDVDA